jgi:hypothetical protein
MAGYNRMDGSDDSTEWNGRSADIDIDMEIVAAPHAPIPHWIGRLLDRTYVLEDCGSNRLEGEESRDWII